MPRNVHQQAMKEAQLRSLGRPALEPLEGIPILEVATPRRES